VFDRYDSQGEGYLGHEQTLEVLEGLNLDFSPGDYQRLVFPKEDGKISHVAFQKIFNIPEDDICTPTPINDERRNTLSLGMSQRYIS